MKKSHHLVILLMPLLLTSSCMRIPNIDVKRSKDYPEDAYIDLENNLYYFGKMDKNTNQKIFQLYESAKIKPTTLMITSQGGDVFLGMELGNFVFDNNLNVVVNRFCFSSCANYVFTAAKNKYLQPDSILGWHGSSWQPDLNQKYIEGDKKIVKWRNQEIDFFDKINVDYRITVSGFEQYKFSDYFKAHLFRKPIMGFNYSVADMKKFGVNNVYFTDKQWNWKEANKCCHILRVQAN